MSQTGHDELRAAVPTVGRAALEVPWPGPGPDTWSVDRDVNVVVVVRRDRPAVLHELPGRPRLPVALLPDDVLHVVGPGVGLDERSDGVTGRPVGHEVDGLARA